MRLQSLHSLLKKLSHNKSIRVKCTCIDGKMNIKIEDWWDFNILSEIEIDLEKDSIDPKPFLPYINLKRERERERERKTKEISQISIDSYNQGVRDAANSAQLMMKKRSQHVKGARWKIVKDEEEIDLFSYELQYSVSKPSILKLLKS